MRMGSTIRVSAENATSSLGGISFGEPENAEPGTTTATLCNGTLERLKMFIEVVLSRNSHCTVRAKTAMAASKTATPATMMRNFFTPRLRSNYNSTKGSFAYFGFSPGGAPDKTKACLLFIGCSATEQAETA